MAASNTARIYQLYSHKEHLTDIESHLQKQTNKKLKKKIKNDLNVSQYNTESKKACIITFVSQSNIEYFHISAS